MSRQRTQFRRAVWAVGVFAGVGASVVFAGCGGDDSVGTTDYDSGTIVLDASKDGTFSDVQTSGDGSTCASDQMACGGECVNVTRDNENCGACGKACGAGEVCSAGTCAVNCGSQETKCSGADAGAPFCTSTRTDNENCGACGNACGAGLVCSNGKCTTTCASGLTTCSGASDAGASDGGDAGTTAPYCAATISDNENCGGCGIACGPGTTCKGGTCATTCGAGLDKCETDAGASFCANFQSDNSNCGSCGNACGAGQSCQSGVCAITCGAGKDVCQPDGGAAYCADFQSDNVNCGSCGNTCGAGTMCSAGTCSTTCGTGLNRCDPKSGASYCASFQSDNSNCGSCGNVCASNQSCQSGICNNVLFTGAAGSTWITVSANGGFAGGFADFSVGSTPFYSNYGDSHLYSYDRGADSWSDLGVPPSPFATDGYYSGAAHVGGSLWAMSENQIVEYDIAGASFSTPLVTSINVTYGGQHAHDDANHVYAISNSGNLLVYDITANTVAEVALSSAISGLDEPRLAWDPTTKLLFGAPAYSSSAFFSIDPSTATYTPLPAVPDQQMSDTFCSDRSGHLYAAANPNTNAMWQYTTATATWVKIADTPFTEQYNGSCTVTSDGWLYFTNGQGSWARIDLH